MGQLSAEVSVLLLPGGILTIDNGTNSERFIRSLTQWIRDGDVPVKVFTNREPGAFLLPDGRAFFLGAQWTHRPRHPDRHD